MSKENVIKVPGLKENIIVVSGLGVEYIDLGDIILVDDDYFFSLIND